MSYCKRGLDGSQVYMYPSGSTPSSESPIVCQYCALQLIGDVWLPTHAAAIAHLLEHRDAGHTVPDAAIDRLRREDRRARRPMPWLE